MSHPSNIVIPARFSFRPYQAHWNICSAEIIDWVDKPETRFLIPLTPPRGLESLLVRLTPQTTSVARMLSMGLEGALQPDSYTVEIDRADVPVEVLPTHENRRNTPDISDRCFETLACQNEHFKQFIGMPIPEGAPKDPWKMRGEFLELHEDIYELRSFLNRWGLWSYARGYYSGMRRDPLSLALAFPHLFWEEREKSRRGLVGKPRTWLTAAKPLTVSNLDEPPYFIVERSYCQDAIEATITINKLEDAKFGICKRHDCKRLYQRNTEQARMYCSPECAHLANVRNLRAKAKKAKSKRSKNATRKN